MFIQILQLQSPNQAHTHSYNRSYIYQRTLQYKSECYRHLISHNKLRPNLTHGRTCAARSAKFAENTLGETFLIVINHAINIYHCDDIYETYLEWLACQHNL